MFLVSNIWHKIKVGFDHFAIDRVQHFTILLHIKFSNEIVMIRFEQILLTGTINNNLTKSGDEIRRKWNIVHTTTIFKKREMLKLLRPKTILKLKLKENVKSKIDDEQTGFSAEKSCIDHIYTLQVIKR